MNKHLVCEHVWVHEENNYVNIVALQVWPYMLTSECSRESSTMPEGDT